MGQDKTPLGKVVSIYKTQFHERLGDMIRGAIEKTLNAIWMPKPRRCAARHTMNAAPAKCYDSIAPEQKCEGFLMLPTLRRVVRRRQTFVSIRLI